MVVNIHEKAGFCWGVVRTVDIAEDTLANKNDTDDKVHILGQIIHNPKEIDRLDQKGLITINHEEMEKLPQGSKVIIRAHGEPPSTYKKADELGLNIIDATCPLVTNLQKRVKNYYKEGYQIIIFGKKEHAEVIGLRGVCNDECVVIRTPEEAQELVDFNRKTALISQTTMDKSKFKEVNEILSSKINSLINLGEIDNKLLTRDTTCRAVTSREEPLMEFAKTHDVIIFVSGRKSSNGKSLYSSCKKVNERTFFIEDMEEIDWTWFEGAETVGISGATSTPQWYMQNVKEAIEEKFNTVAV